VLTKRDRPAAENRMVDDRLKSLLPRLMQESGLDMWLVLNREYAEDPVYFTLVPQPSFAAFRSLIMFLNIQFQQVQVCGVRCSHLQVCTQVLFSNCTNRSNKISSMESCTIPSVRP
jgi:hypothetical protein